MALSTGLAAQIGFKAESTYGTYVAPTSFFPLIAEAIKLDRPHIVSKAIRTGRIVTDTSDWAQGTKTITGQVQFELYDRTSALLFVHAFGSVATSGAGPYTHTITPGNLLGKSLTMQIGRPDSSGTVRAFSYLGTKVKGWSINAKPNELVKMTLDFLARDEDTAQSLATASYTSGIKPFVFTGAAVSLGGSSLTNCREVTINGANALTDRRYVNSALMGEPVDADMRSYTGTILMEFDSFTQYNRYTGGTEAAVVLTFTQGSNTITLTTNARFTGNTPNVTGPDMLTLPLDFALDGTTDANAITAVCVNGDSAP